MHMIHDFATFPKQPVSVVEPSTQQAPAKMHPIVRRVLVRVLLVAMVVFGVSFLMGNESDVAVEFSPGLAESKEYEQAVEEVVAVQENVKTEKAAPSRFHVVATKPDAEDSEFGFYDSLQTSQWDVPVQQGVYFTEEDKKKARYTYILQAASMKSRSDASKLVAKLQSMKMKASYSIITSDYGAVWYRVNVGPFSNQSLMNKAEDRLVSMGMMPLKRRVR